MRWQIEKGIRCDIVVYAAVNMGGKRSAIRIFPGGNRQGDLTSRDVGSMVIRAPYGVRVLLVSKPGSAWESAPWRCIRLLEGHSLRSDGVGLPGVRIPNVEALDKHGAPLTDRERERSYPLAATLAEGEGWSFGRPGPLREHVNLIRVERDRPGEDVSLPVPDTLVRKLWTRLQTRSEADALLSDLGGAFHEALTEADEADIATRVRQFEEWAREQEP